MRPSELERYLHEQIPLSRAMAVAVIECGIERVVLSAPLAPNINHRDSVFGGSANAVATLAAWSSLHIRLNASGMSCRVVIQHNTMHYDAPIMDTFTACAAVTPDRWQRFMRTLERRRRARITVAATLECADRVVGRMEGAFVADDTAAR